MRCLLICLGISCQVVPCQANVIRSIIRLEVAKKYGIKEDVVMAGVLSLCCGCCSDLQVENEIMVKEDLKFGCAQVTKDEMSR